MIKQSKNTAKKNTRTTKTIKRKNTRVTKNKIKYSYEDIDTEQVKMLASLGWSYEEIGAFFGIPETTFSTWVTQNKNGFGDAFVNGVDVSVRKVERALYERAIGYYHPETKVTSLSQGRGEASIIETTEIIKHYPPDVQACIFYLTNKRRHQWKHRFELQTYTDENKLPDMSDLKFNELRILAGGNGMKDGNLRKNKVDKRKLKKDVKELSKKIVSKN